MSKTTSTMHSNYIIRRSESNDDAAKLNELFTGVFHPEDVGTLAETMFHHLPRRERRYWFIAEEKSTSQLVSAFTLIPWTWEIEGVRLKTAELGIVGTHKDHRKRGLMKLLNAEFDKTIRDDGFDIAVIQGIPGFYHNFGFHYAIPLENTINVQFSSIPDKKTEPYTFRLANQDNIPYLMSEDDHYRSLFSVSSHRDEANWQYLMTHSLKTEYGSEYWIMERDGLVETFYFRIPQNGFGDGLIISEISDRITHDALCSLLRFCKKKAIERKKPYIRLNLHNNSRAAGITLSMGAEKKEQHAFQIKIPDVGAFITRIAPVLENRIAGSCFAGLTETIRLDFFTSNLDLAWKDGKLISVGPGDGECPTTMSITSDYIPALCLGHRSWRELRHIKPVINISSPQCGLLIDTLFPKQDSWIHEQY